MFYSFIFTFIKINFFLNRHLIFYLTTTKNPHLTKKNFNIHAHSRFRLNNRIQCE